MRRRGTWKKVEPRNSAARAPTSSFDDADPSSAIAGAASAIFFNHGQCCVAGSRLYVQEGSFDEVVDGVAAIAKSIKLGPGTGARHADGPAGLRRATAPRDRPRRLRHSRGATALSGGRRHGNRGYFVEPTVLTNTHPEMTVVREEIFGPVVVATPFSDLDEVAAAANDTPYGLGAGIWTKDISKAHALAKKIRAGHLYQLLQRVRRSAAIRRIQAVRLGREMGHEVLNNYTEVKAVTTQL